MKISELIRRLEAIRSEKGDLLVVEGDDWRCGAYFAPITKTAVVAVGACDYGFNHFFEGDGVPRQEVVNLK